MTVLIVESKTEIAQLWQRHLERLELKVDHATTADQAVDFLVRQSYRVMVVNLFLPEGGAFGIADYARVKSPGTKCVFVTDQTFFRDGSLFGLVPNLRMMVKTDMPPQDLAEIVGHYASVA